MNTLRGVVSARSGSSFRRLSGGIALAVLFSIIPATAATADDPPGQSPEEANAAPAVVEEPVEIPELTTENRRVVENPDGTRTATVNAAPVRVRRNGSWLDVDTDLARRADGMVAPKVAPVDLAFSGGGSGPLARIADEGRSMSLGWPTALPAPTLVGDTAVYANVIPNVDLVVQSGRDGFSTFLVVKTREAATSPALAQIRFSLSSTGLTVSDTPEGGLAATDAEGRVVFGGPRARMWDSKGAVTEPAGLQPQGTEATSIENSAEAINEPMEARTAAVPVDVAGGTVTVVPDQELLTRPDAVFPIVVDPGVSRLRKRTYWTMLWSDTQKFPNHATEHARVGFDGWEDNKISRVFYRFDTTEFAGKHILSAEFAHKQIHSPSYACGEPDGPAVLLGRTDSFSAESGWGNQPRWDATISSSTATRGHRNECPNDIIQEWDAEAGVEHVAANRKSTLSLGLRSANESDEWGWRQYDNTADHPALTVVYNSKPNKPTNVRIATPLTACVASSSSAPVVGDATLTLQATLSDPDGASAEMKPRFEVYTATGTTPVWQQLHPTEFQSGATVKVTTPALSSNVVYRFKVRAEESITSTPVEPADFGPYSGYCYFKIDTVAPDPPIVTSDIYTRCIDGSCPASGGVGKIGNFTFDGGSDTVTYRYQLNGGAWNFKPAPSPGAPVTVQIWPAEAEVSYLIVEALDSAGNPSKSATYAFNVAVGAPPTSIWNLEEKSGVTAADSNTGPNKRPLTISGAGTNAGWSDQGRAGGDVWSSIDPTKPKPRSLRFDGVDDFAATSAAAVSTTNSFTVAAWVRVEALTNNMTVARQAHNGHHSFLLYYSKSANRWGFQRQNPNDPTVVSTAFSDSAPAVGSWTHLVGVYDGAGARLLLYVNGVLEGTANFSTPWHVTDPFELGRWSYTGVTGVPFKGRIDQVRLWNRFVAPSEVERLTNEVNSESSFPQPALVGEWMFDTPSSTADSSGYGATVTLGSGAHFVQDPVKGQVLRVNSTAEGYAKTAGGVPVIDGKGSFTITAWVRPTNANHVGNLVAQGSHGTAEPGTAQRSYGLGLSRTSQRRWVFDRLDNDRATTTSVVSEDVLTADDFNLQECRWVHVAATYDRVGGKEIDDPNGHMSLFVNGTRQHDAGDGVPFTNPWHTATGPIWFGGELPGTGSTTTFEGDLADIRIYTGVLRDSDIYQQWMNGDQC